MVSQIPVFILVGFFATSADFSVLQSDNKENKERVKLMIAFLDSEDWRIDKATEVLGALTQLAPSDVEAQNVTVRYLERAVSHGVRLPIFYARLLSQYDAGFGDAVMTSLAKTKNPEISELWLVTLALMGKKADKQVEPLTRYLHQQVDPVNSILVRIVLAVMGTAPPDSFNIIEKEIHERTEAGRAAVRMAALVGFPEWGSAKSVSEVRHWLTEAVSEDDRCMAAIALAVSGCRDEMVARNIRGLLAEAMKDPGSSARICYAYALILLEPDLADHYWYVILKKLGLNQFNHTDGSAVLIVSVSIPVKQITIVNRLRNDSDSEIAAEAAKLGKMLEVFKRAEVDSAEKKENKPPRVSPRKRRIRRGHSTLTTFNRQSFSASASHVKPTRASVESRARSKGCHCLRTSLVPSAAPPAIRNEQWCD